MDRIRTIVVGCGNFCANTIPGILKDEGFKIVAVVDPDRARRDTIGEMAGVDEPDRYASDREAYAQREVDFAFVFSTISSHAENCRTALEAGCPVSVAKPFVEQLSDGIDLVRLARDRGLWISVGQTARLGPHGRLLWQFIQDGELGDPGFGNYYMYRNRINNLRDYQLHERWPVINATSIHQFDLYRYLFDTDIIRVCFRGRRTPWDPYDDPGMVTGWLELGNGMIISFFQSFTSLVQRGDHHPYNHVMLQGSKGALFWGEPLDQGGMQFHREHDQHVVDLPIPPVDYREQTYRYCRWIRETLRDGREVYAEAGDNLWSLAAIKSAEFSAAQGGMIVDVLEFGRLAGLPKRKDRSPE